MLPASEIVEQPTLFVIMTRHRGVADILVFIVKVVLSPCRTVALLVRFLVALSVLSAPSLSCRVFALFPSPYSSPRPFLYFSSASAGNWLPVRPCGPTVLSLLDSRQPQPENII